MNVTHDASNGGQVTISLLGTPVIGDDPRSGIGEIKLTAYGAKRLAYELLLNVTDAEHYASAKVYNGPEVEKKTMEWKDIPPDTDYDLAP